MSAAEVRVKRESNPAEDDMYMDIVQKLVAKILLFSVLCMLGKNVSRQQFEIFFLFFLENRIRH